MALSRSIAMTLLTQGAMSSAALPVPQPTSATVQSGSSRPRMRFGGERLAEEFASQGIPLAADAAEELARIGPPFAQDLIEAREVVFERVGVLGPRLGQFPDAGGIVIDDLRRETVHARRARRSLDHPVGFQQRFEMAADGRLRQLHDARDLAHAEFLALQRAEDPQAHHITDRVERIEKRHASGELTTEAQRTLRMH